MQQGASTQELLPAIPAALGGVRAFVRHDDDCHVTHEGEEAPCSCGARVALLAFDDAVRALTTTPEPTEPAGVAGLAAINRDFRNLPDVPSRETLWFFARMAGITKWPEDWETGKRLQREHPDTIPAKTELELAAGLWFRIATALRTPPLLEVAKEALEPGADERGWLIETSFGPHIHYIGLCDPHDYWREQREKDRSTYGRSALVGIIRFCRDANDACRFARKQDAQQLVDALGQLLTDPQICEHEWPAALQAIKGAEQ